MAQSVTRGGLAETGPKESTLNDNTSGVRLFHYVDVVRGVVEVKHGPPPPTSPLLATRLSSDALEGARPRRVHLQNAHGARLPATTPGV